MTERIRISSGSTFEEQIGYSRAVVDGDWIFVSGTTGFDYATMTIADDVVAQAEQCLANIDAALGQAGATGAASAALAELGTGLGRQADLGHGAAPYYMRGLVADVAAPTVTPRR